jgi:hypothetical protein
LEGVDMITRSTLVDVVVDLDVDFFGNGDVDVLL